MVILTFCHEMRPALFARHDLHDSASQNSYKVSQYILILKRNRVLNQIRNCIFGLLEISIYFRNIFQA